MERVTGIGGIFFKSRDKQALLDWYAKHLGFEPTEYGFVMFRWGHDDAPESKGMTLWTPFAQDTEYFGPSESPFMINFRVKDLDAMLVQLKAGGVDLVGTPEDNEYGKFAWILDPEGRKLELWQPPEGQ